MKTQLQQLQAFWDRNPYNFSGNKIKDERRKNENFILHDTSLGAFSKQKHQHNSTTRII